MNSHLRCELFYVVKVLIKDSFTSCLYSSLSSIEEALSSSQSKRTPTEIGGPPSSCDGGRLLSLTSSPLSFADTGAARRPLCIAFISMLSAVEQRKTDRLLPEPLPRVGALLGGAPRRPPRRLLGDTGAASDDLAACAMCRMSMLSAVSFRSSRLPPMLLCFFSSLGESGGVTGSVVMMAV